jgi:hypothetical protein
MPIFVACECGAKMRAPDRLAGRSVFCPACSRQLLVPATNGAASAPAAPPNIQSGRSFPQNVRSQPARQGAVAGAGNPASQGYRSPPKSGPVRRPPSKPELDPSVAEIDEDVQPPAKAVAVAPAKTRTKKTAGKGKAKGLSSRLPKGVWIGAGIGVFAVLALSALYWLAGQYQSQEYVAVVGSGAGGPVAQGSGSSHPILVKVSKLLDDYERDEKEADELYLGNILQVDGNVAIMRKTDDGKVMLELKEGARLTMHVADCEFGFSGQRALGSVQTGDQVTVVGRCDGKHNKVILKDCHLLQSSMPLRNNRLRQGN